MMKKVMNKYEINENIYFPIYDCFEVVDNVYEINPETGVIRVILTKEIIKPIIAQGYNLVPLFTKRNTPTRYQVHRIVANMFVFQPDGKYIVNHKNGIRNDNHYKNLEWCTDQENVDHAINTGLSPIGDKNPNAKLTNNQVHEICRLMCENVSDREILRRVRLPETKKMLDILIKIRTKNLWTSISDLYPMPGLLKPKSAEIRYEEEFINLFCQMISEGKSNREIATYMEIDLKNKRHIDKFYRVLNRIRNRETYTEISKNYNW